MTVQLPVQQTQLSGVSPRDAPPPLATILLWPTHLRLSAKARKAEGGVHPACHQTSVLNQSPSSTHPTWIIHEFIIRIDTRARAHTHTHTHTHARTTRMRARARAHTHTHTRSRPPGAIRVLSEAILLALEAIVPGLAMGLFQCRFSTSLQARQGSSQGLVKKRVQTCACPGLQACEQTRARGCRRKCTQRSLSEFLQERGEGWRMLRVQQGGTREGLQRCSHLFCQGGRKRERGRHRSSRPRTLNQSPLSDAISATPDVQTRQE